MPVFNGALTLPNAINSILNQTMKEWELIVVDDGSTDSTKQVVQSFKDFRISYYYMSHAGIVAARNRGNTLAKAEYIAMQDADDLSMPDRLEKSLAEMKKTGADVLYHGIYKNMWNTVHQCIDREYVPALSFNKHVLVKRQYIPGVCIFKKKCWLAKPFRIETQFAFDWMMHLDWAFSGFMYRALDAGLYEYVRQESSSSAQFEREGKRQHCFEAIKEIMQKEYGIKS